MKVILLAWSVSNGHVRVWHADRFDQLRLASRSWLFELGVLRRLADPIVLRIHGRARPSLGHHQLSSTMVDHTTALKHQNRKKSFLRVGAFAVLAF
jgi:hypothetical protein